MSETAVVSSDASRDNLTPPAVPRTIKWAIAAVCVQVGFSLVRVFSMFGYTDELKKILAKDLNTTFRNNLSNYLQDFGKVLQGKKTSATFKDLPYHDLDKALHAIRINGLWQGLVVAVALLLLAWSLRRTSTASVTRWALLIVMALTGGPFTVIPAKGLPTVPQVALVLAGVASIAAIVLLFVPPSREYFRAVAAQRRMGMPGGATPRPRLFGPRQPVEAKPAATTSVLRSSAASRAQARSSKAKSRNDAEAIARGAALARSRAKSSKSRRSEF